MPEQQNEYGIGVLIPAPVACRSALPRAISRVRCCAVLSNNLPRFRLRSARPFGHLARLALRTTCLPAPRTLISVPLPAFQFGLLSPDPCRLLPPLDLLDCFACFLQPFFWQAAPRVSPVRAVAPLSLQFHPCRAAFRLPREMRKSVCLGLSLQGRPLTTLNAQPFPADRTRRLVHRAAHPT
jgi:hypothetical protein